MGQVDMDVDVGIERLVVIHWLAFKFCIQALEHILVPITVDSTILGFLSLSLSFFFSFLSCTIRTNLVFSTHAELLDFQVSDCAHQGPFLP